MRALGPFAAFEQGEQVLAVDHTIVGHLGSSDGSAGRQKIHAGPHFRALLAGRDAAGPPHHGGHAHPALKAGELIAFERIGESPDASVHITLYPGLGGKFPWTIVGGVYDQGVLIELELAQRLEDLPGRPIKLLDGVPVQPDLAFSFEWRSGVEGNVRHGVWQIDEEGVLLVLPDEGNGFLGVTLGEGVLVGRVFDDLGIAHEGYEVFLHPVLDVLQGDPFPQNNVIGQGLSRIEGHVVAIRNTEVGVEALASGQEFLKVPEVPFPDTGCGVALGFEQVRYGDLIRVEAPLITREKNA